MVILPSNKELTAFVCEFKALKQKAKTAPKDAAAQAPEQISVKKYVEGVKAEGYTQVKAIGIGFKGKEVKVIYGF